MRTHKVTFNIRFYLSSSFGEVLFHAHYKAPGLENLLQEQFASSDCLCFPYLYFIAFQFYAVTLLYSCTILILLFCYNV